MLQDGLCVTSRLCIVLCCEEEHLSGRCVADSFEAERDDLLKRIAVCQSSASESHTLRCESQKRAEEVRELQSALSDAHVHLFDERHHLLQLQAENDELRLQAMEDQKRIQHLVAVTQPVEQEITYSGGHRAGVVRKQSAQHVTTPGALLPSHCSPAQACACTLSTAATTSRDAAIKQLQRLRAHHTHMCAHPRCTHSRRGSMHLFPILRCIQFSCTPVAR